MTEFSFSDKDLQLAAGKVRSALLESLPTPSDCAREFSDPFLEKMDGILQQDKRQQARKSISSNCSCIFGIVQWCWSAFCF